MVLTNVRGLNTTAVSSIRYNALGQRTRIDYGNNTRTEYIYDANTFKVRQIRTTRTTDTKVLQELDYFYDPVGNITWQQDAVQATVFFANGVAGPDNKYTYDALYRLIKAEGREHAGNNTAPDWNDGSRVGLTPIPYTNTAAMRSYTQLYTYDGPGNMLSQQHIAATGWTRTYTLYATNNRLRRPHD